ncbi:VOC family protein [Saccharothrix saharensis]|uniref:VOC family protein n=1 Tax=Saccharothrix saharensis TaxID=571190 RepID=UPI0036978CDA
MTLRFEVFPQDLDTTVKFYTDVLGFTAERYEPDGPHPYASLVRDEVCVGVSPRPQAVPAEHRRPPVGVELVFEVDDVEVEARRIETSGWPIEEELQHRPWGLRDFRICDPNGYYVRITERTPGGGSAPSTGEAR